MFKNDYEYKILIGSSNLTQTALSTNQEWNICLTSFANGELVDIVNEEFEDQWENSIPLTLEWIQHYEQVYVEQKKHTIKAPKAINTIKPNYMQKEALLSLKRLREAGEDRGLLISATGTGKTFLSAFDVKLVNPKKMLFVVHRENIAKKALETFQKIMPDKSFGIFTGNIKEKDADYLFSTIQTMGKDHYLHLFDNNEFDYIVIDEVHHAGASLYLNLLNYFNPKFLLGMTATPERTDGFDIYDLFKHNIAYEIRLQQAMEYDLLCPFHYYGITDMWLDNEEVDLYNFALLASEKRANHIIEAINKYHYSGNKVHGLIFVSRKEEAHELSRIFNQKGYRTVALTGEDSEAVRRHAIDRLELPECPEALDYIFTVDIFNEGIDIPSVNQVVMARPTESAIIFVQQLGRGLRKDLSKEYVVVIDIIGNYEKNFLIPIALSGNLSYNKDTLRHFLFEGSLVLPGASTINFDEITRKRIFESIDVANFNDIKIIKESYKQLKLKLGRIPTLFDFDKYESIDPLRIFDSNSLGSYHCFLKKYEKEYKISFSTAQEELLEYVSRKFASGKRLLELIALKVTILKQNNIISNIKLELEKHNQVYDSKVETTLINQLTHNFATGGAKTKFPNAIYLEKSHDDYCISKQFKLALLDEKFKAQILEVIDFGIHRYYKNYSQRYQNTDLVLYQKYTYEDVCRLLNWEKSEVALNIGGYKYDKFSKTFPVFINYEKGDVQKTILYEDHFTSPNDLIAISKSNRSLESDDVKTIYHSKERDVTIHLFVRKNKDDKTSKEFYYLGTMLAYGTPKEFIMKNTTSTAVELFYKLDTPVRSDIYDYLTG